MLMSSKHIKSQQGVGLVEVLGCMLVLCYWYFGFCSIAINVLMRQHLESEAAVEPSLLILQ